MAMGKVILDHLRVSAKGIRMVHVMGWYRDPEARPASRVLKDKCYEKIITERKYPFRSPREIWIEAGRIGGVISNSYAIQLKARAR